MLKIQEGRSQDVLSTPHGITCATKPKTNDSLNTFEGRSSIFVFSLGRAHRVISMASEHCAARVIETDSSARKQEQEG